ncbi:MAG: hypothetical protein AB1405_02005 [Bdellovibrionota bacterium]
MSAPEGGLFNFNFRGAKAGTGFLAGALVSLLFCLGAYIARENIINPASAAQVEEIQRRVGQLEEKTPALGDLKKEMEELSRQIREHGDLLRETQQDLRDLRRETQQEIRDLRRERR